MQNAKSSRRGVLLALGILILAFAAAISGRLHYNAGHPAALEAHFLAENQIVAKFDPEHAAILQVGLPASISTEGNGFSGFLIDQTGANTFIIALDSIPDPPAPGTPCRVIVDASIAPEYLKPRLPSE